MRLLECARQLLTIGGGCGVTELGCLHLDAFKQSGQPDVLVLHALHHGAVRCRSVHEDRPEKPVFGGVVVVEGGDAEVDVIDYHASILAVAIGHPTY